MRTWQYVEIVKETHVCILLWLCDYFLKAAIKFNTKLWKPPKISFETLEVYDDVWVPGNTWKSLKKLMFVSSYKLTVIICWTNSWLLESSLRWSCGSHQKCHWKHLKCMMTCGFLVRNVNHWRNSWLYPPYEIYKSSVD